MIVLDAYAVLALLQDERAADDVERLIERDNATLTALGLAEVLDHLVRLAGAEEDDALLDLAQIGLDAPPLLDASVAARAGLLRARRYDRNTSALSLADCVAVETARSLDAPLASADPPLLAACLAEGVAFVALPDTRGRTWRG